MLTALSVLPTGFACTTSTKKEQIGLQMYSLRTFLDEDFEGTMQALINMGIKRFESFGYRNGLCFGKTSKEMKASLAGMGGQITSAHIGIPFPQTPEQLDIWKKTCEDTKEVGATWVIQASYPTSQMQTIADVMRLAEQFNRCGEIAKSYDLHFAFHNHRDEFYELEGQIPYDVLMNNTDKNLVTYEIDCGHVLAAGANLAECIKKHPGRFSLYHLRDVDASGQGIAVGQGLTNWEEFFGLAKIAGLKDCYIELGGASMEDIKSAHAFLMNAPYVKW